MRLQTWKHLSAGLLSLPCLLPLLACAAILALGGVAGAQTISTFAGGGTVYGDGGPATTARLLAPWGIAIDAAGNVYVGDDADSVVRRIDRATGLITTIAGNGTALICQRNYGGPGVVGSFDGAACGDGGPATSASLIAPVDLAVDQAGNVYIVDPHNWVIRKVDVATGIITTVAGGGPFGVDLDPFFAGDGGPATDAVVQSPFGVAVDAAGNLYIGDPGNVRVRKVTAATGIIDTIAGNGTFSSTGDGGPARQAGFSSVDRVALDGLGNIYVVDSLIVRRIDAVTGIITTVAGGGTSTGESGLAVGADLGQASSIALDAAGNLYIAGWDRFRVWIVDPSGAIRVLAGTGTAGFSGDGGPAIAAQFNLLYGIDAAGNGDVYISDGLNHRVRKVTVAAGPDTTPPVISGVPAGLVAEAASSAGIIVAYTPPTALDDVDGAVAVTCAPPPGTPFPIGTTTVTCVATDAAGNDSSASFTVSVQDTQPPTFGVLTDVATEAMSAAGAVASYPLPTATDAVDPAPVVSCAPASGGTFPIGVTTVMCTATDDSGNTGSGAFTVTLTLTPVNLMPVANAGADQTVEATSAAGASVTLDAAASFDPEGAALGFTWTGPFGTASGASPVVTLPLGTRTVTLTVSDGQAAAADTVAINVRDTTPPLLACPSTVVAEATSGSGAVVFYPPATATDAVDPTPLVTYSRPSGTGFPHPGFTVFVQARDSAGNVSGCQFTIEVRDTTPPTIEPIRLDPSVDPLAQGYQTEGTGDYAPGGRLAIDNTSTLDHRTFFKTVPELATSVVSVDVTLQVQDGSVVLGGFETGVRAILNEGAGGVEIAVALVQQSPSERSIAFVIGQNEGHSQFSQSIPFDWLTERTFRIERRPGIVSGGPGQASLIVPGHDPVTVSRIGFPPATRPNPSFEIGVGFDDGRARVLVSAIGPRNRTIEATSAAGAIVSYPALVASDIVDDTPTVTCTPESGAFILPLGVHTVTCQATDDSGNSSLSESFTVTVQDTTAPALACPSNLSAGATSSSGAIVTYPGAVVSDAADPAPVITYSQASGTLFPIGTTPVQVTATDATGHTSQCGFSVTVTPSSNFAPVAGDQALSTAEDTGAPIILTGSDSNGDALSYLIVSPPAHGVLSGTAPNLLYTPTPNYNGPDSFTFRVNDGAMDSNHATVGLTVTPVNDAPQNAVPGPQGTAALLPLLFSAGAGNPISVSDIDAGTNALLVTLASSNGTLTLAGTAGLTFNRGDGSGDAAMSFTATMESINAALDGMRFTPRPGFNGRAVLTMRTSDNGHSGAGGPMSDTDTLSITVGPDAAADLAITMAGRPNPASVGRNVIYSIRVTNNGPFTATSVSLVDVMPTVSSFVSVSTSQGTCAFVSFMRTVRCNLGSLVTGSTARLTLVIRPTQAVPNMVNAAVVLANQADPDSENNFTAVLTPVR